MIYVKLKFKKNQIIQFFFGVCYRNPTPSKNWLVNVIWKPITYEEGTYLNIDTELSLQIHLNKERITFWDEIFRSIENNT